MCVTATRNKFESQKCYCPVVQPCDSQPSIFLTDLGVGSCPQSPQAQFEFQIKKKNNNN